ncbi:MAG: hypothetical protein QOG16_1345, partial [Actinomycetota bacterium]|nr:hypothetical protein [Actinomycetota bacterium]
MSLFVGTSGWAYKEWKPDFYPQDLPQKRFLEHYGDQLTACEINATFYRRQSDETFIRWREAVPDDFRFAVKAHRGISYTLDLSMHEGKVELIAGFRDSIANLKKKLGPVMIQFPHKDAQPEAVLELVEVMPDKIPYALDFRKQEVWDTPELRKGLAERGATICYSDRTGDVPNELPPGPIAYVRLRVERYTEEQRASWLDLFQKEAIERDVYVFVK